MLTTLAAAKSFLGVTGATEDTEITDFILASEQQMERKAGRHLEAESVTTVMDGTGTRNLWLPEPPLSLTTVHVSSSQSWTDATLQDTTEMLLKGCRIYWTNRTWLNAPMAVRVVYQAGVALTVPELLADACRRQVANLYSEWKAAQKGDNILSRQRIGEWTQEYLAREGLDPYVEKVCDSYRPKKL